MRNDIAEFTEEIKAQHGPDEIRPYTTRSFTAVARAILPPQEFFLGDVFAMGQVQCVVGQGGLGKSRLSLNMVRNQVLQIPFADMPTGNRPLRHLLMGSENSIYRLQYDTRRMLRGLTDEECTRLDEFIELATIEAPHDAYISLGSESNLVRWQKTIEHCKPDVLWVDPYGDVHAGDANSDNDTRYTISTLFRLLREVNPDAGLVILHHSRTGANNIAQATGFDAANFGKGSKALYSASRAQINLAPYDESESPAIVMVCAKNNNARRFEPLLLTLDEETMTYTSEPIDIEEWHQRVLTAARGSKKPQKVSVVPLADYHHAVLNALSDGPIPSGSLHTKVKAAIGKGDKYVSSLIADCVFHEVIAKTPRIKEKDGRVLYGTPKQVTAILNPELKGV